MTRRHTRQRALALAAAVIMTALASFAVATPAWAHSQLLSTDPVDGATVTAPIAEVRLTFNERVQGRFSTVVINGPGTPGGTVFYSRGHVQVIDDVVHQPVYALRSGAYSVAWRAISADGHPVDGQFSFTVALPAAEEPTAGPPTPAAIDDARHGGGLAWIGGGIAALAVAGLLVVWALRRPRAKKPDAISNNQAADR